MEKILPQGLFSSDLSRQVETVVSNRSSVGGVCICTAGEADYIINGRSYHLTKGYAFVKSPIIVSSLVVMSDDFDLLEMTVPLPVLLPVFTKIVSTVISLQIPDYPCHQLTEEECEEMIDVNEQLNHYKSELKEEVNEDRREILKVLIENMIQGVLLWLLEKFSKRIMVGQSQESNNKIDGITYQFFLSLYLNYKHEHSVQFYAASLGYSAGYFTSLIRKNTGKTPSEIIAIRIITEAKCLLKDSNLNIKQISLELGFPEQFTFRKYFKQHVGVSPKLYRQQFVGNIE